jgi:TonB-linked SusC/RagA family outer membrane protein
MLSITQVFAQNRTYTGTVIDKADGTSMPGVTVLVKGTKIGTQTKGNGEFSISAPAGAILEFKFIGYASQTVPGGTNITVSLVAESNQLSEVVVTGAFGIKKQEREVAYATTRISGASADQTAPINPLNGLTGKVAGLVIQQTDDGIDPSIKVNLRGSRSLLGNNDALFIVDGVPVSGAIVASLNPNEIQDYNVLNGAGAAALYGSEASNGAIVITLKKGTSDGKPVITYSNSLQLQQVADLPKLQSSYGQYGGEGQYTTDFGFPPGYDFLNTVTGNPLQVPFENELWGPAFDGSTVTEGYFHPGVGTNNVLPLLTSTYSPQKTNNVKAFFQTGVTEQNGVSYAQGDQANSFNFTIGDVEQKGILPEDRSERVSARIGATKTYGIFRADISASYARSTISTTGGTDYTGNNNIYDNILQFPDNLNINASYFKDVNDPNSYGNPNYYFSGYSSNPWWTIENNRTNIERNQFVGNMLLTLTPTKWFDVSYRVSENFGTYHSKNTIAGVTYNPAVSGDGFAADIGLTPVSYPNGIAPQTTDIIGYGDGTGTIVNTGGAIPNFASGNGNGLDRLEGDAQLNFHHTFFNDWKAGLLLGNTIYEEKGNYTYDNDTKLLIPGDYNVLDNAESPTLYTGSGVIREISFLGDFNLAYKNWAFLELTGRNDQDSRLALANDSYFYPSEQLSLVPTDMFPQIKSNVLDYLKVYANNSKVGQVSLPPYSINATYVPESGFPFGGLGGYKTSGTFYPPSLKPESITTVEFGAEFGLFNDRVDIKGDYYDTKSRNQTLSITTSPATGYNNSVINAGEIQDKGEEFSVNAIIFPKTANGIGWTLGGNLSYNANKVISLVDGQGQLDLGGSSYAIVGKSFPQILTTDFIRDPQGREVVDPVLGVGTVDPNLKDFGGATPKINLGLNTALSYKFVTLTVVAEYRGGAVVYNNIGAEMEFAGSDYFSSQAGRSIFIIPNSSIQTGPNTYVKNTTVPVFNGGLNYWVESAGGPNAVGSTYISSADFWKIREVSLDFNLNQFINKTHAIKGLSIGFDARNLLTFLPKSEMWGDPELSDAGTSNAVGVTTTGQLPSSRYFGAKLNVTF